MRSFAARHDWLGNLDSIFYDIQSSLLGSNIVFINFVLLGVRSALYSHCDSPILLVA